MTGKIRRRMYLMVVASMDGRKVFLRPSLRIVVAMSVQGNMCCGLARWLNHGSSEEDVTICSGDGQLGIRLLRSRRAAMYMMASGSIMCGREGRCSERMESMSSWYLCWGMAAGCLLWAVSLREKLRKCVSSVLAGSMPEHLLPRNFFNFACEELYLETDGHEWGSGTRQIIKRRSCPCAKEVERPLKRRDGSRVAPAT